MNTSQKTDELVKKLDLYINRCIRYVRRFIDTGSAFAGGLAYFGRIRTLIPATSGHLVELIK